MPITTNYRLRIKERQAFLIAAVLVLGFFSVKSVYADDPCKNISDLDDKAACYDKEIRKKEDKLSEILEEKDSVLKRIEELSSKLDVTESEINSLQAEITDMKARLDEINKNLKIRQESLATKINLRNRIIRTYYQSGILNNLEMFLAGVSDSSINGFQYSALAYIFQKSTATSTVQIIGVLNSEISSFEKDKKDAEELKAGLEQAQANLLKLETQLAEEKKSKQGEVAGLESQQKDLSKQIADLSAKQQSILAQKAGEGIVSGYEAPEYKLPSPPFKPAFAAMSYGAYTHYNGMSQYGAKGRAEDGQDYKDILKFYYKSDVTEKDGFPDEISVQGYGDLDFQYYLYGIAEMPTSWPSDALKAQAIAARTYAYKAGKPICTTESCQVFSKSKADDVKDGKYPNWKDAVDDTKDKILKDSSTSQYSSTTGGYINSVGWDKKGSWPGDAYEKRSKSPWFYKAWYTQSYYDNSSTCDRSTPWLKESEMADVLNAWVVWRHGSSDEKDHISPVTTNCWGGDPYSNDEMANKADKYGDRFESVDKVWADQGNNGQTATIHFTTNAGTVSIDGQEFKTVFNLRAPAYVSLRSRLYDFEQEN